MMAWLVGVAALAGACAPLRSAPLAEVGPPEYARITAQRQLDIRAGETSAERALWAVLSRDPATVAAAVLGVEDELGRTQLREYDLSLAAGGVITVRSRYIAQTGQCVLLRRPVGVGHAILVNQDEARCAAPG